MEIFAPRVNLEEKDVKDESSGLVPGFLERAVQPDWTDLNTLMNLLPRAKPAQRARGAPGNRDAQKPASS